MAAHLRGHAVRAFDPARRYRRTLNARLARPTLSARRDLGRRGRQLRALLRARDRRRALPVRRDADARRSRSRISLASAPTMSGTATCPTCARPALRLPRRTGRTTRARAPLQPREAADRSLREGDHRRDPAGATTLFGYTVGHPDDDLEPDDRDSAGGVPKCVVVDPAFTWGDDRPPRMPWNRTVIYECHVKGMTKLHPGRAGGAARHLPRARQRPDDRAPARARRHRGRAAAGAPVRRRPASRRARPHELLGLQLARLLRARRALRRRAAAASRWTSSRRW